MGHGGSARVRGVVRARDRGPGQRRGVGGRRLRLGRAPAYLRTFGPSGGLTGFVTGAIFVIANGIPAGSLDVGTRTLWFMLGSS